MRTLATMIVSASYKTDIPAFYGAWFINRLRKGYCRTRNPWGGQVVDVPLDRNSVDGFVFWTRNAAPFMHALYEVRRRGYPFFVHYTITGYPRALERSVPEPERAIRSAHELAREYGPDAVVWRYDPIQISSLTPAAFHLENFAGLAKRLTGAANEVVVSFTHLYRKTRRNLDRAGAEAGFAWSDPSPQQKRGLVIELTRLAGRFGFKLSVCAQPAFMAGGAEAARCIDAARLARLGGAPIAARERGNRPGCACHQSKDIGEYETCPHGCNYCYAVDKRARAIERLEAHDPAGALLAPPSPSFATADR